MGQERGYRLICAIARQCTLGCAFACECVPSELWPKSGPPPAATLFLRREALIRKGTAVRPSPIFSLRPTGIDSESGQGDGWRTKDWTPIRTMLSGRAALSGQGFSMTGGPAVRTQPSPLTAHVAAGLTPINPWDSDNRGPCHRPGPGWHGPAFTEPPLTGAH